MDDVVSCAAYGSSAEANAAIDRLAVGGIDATLGERTAMDFHVLVADRDCDAAISVLSGLTFDDGVDVPRAGRAERGFGWLLVVLLIAPLVVGLVVAAISFLF